MADSCITAALLDRGRFEGDRPADDLVDALAARGQLGSARALIAAIVHGGAAPEGPIRDAWQEFAASEQLEPVDLALLIRSERVFRAWGPQWAMALCFGSLGGGYAAYRVSHLLAGVSRLESSPSRRVFETLQLLFDVMDSGGLEPGGRGIESAQRVRLMHAGVRRLVREYQAQHGATDLIAPNGDIAWKHEWGVPINQEDMIGTIMTMSVHVVNCLAIQGIRLSEQDQWALVATWLRVGRVMGVTEAFIPNDLQEARQLWTLIQERQFRESAAGAEVEDALLRVIAPLLPWHAMRFIPRGLVWTFCGPQVSRMVGLAPLRPHERLGLAIWLGFERAMNRLEARNRLARHRLGSAGTNLLRRLDRRELGGKRAPFAIPRELAGEWALYSHRRYRRTR